MSKVIWKLREDHRNMARLLSLVGREINALREGEVPDYYLVESILDYLMNFPDLSHHPIEDMVYAKLKERDADAADALGNLSDEHQNLDTLIKRFSAALKNVLADETLPRDWFAGIASDYQETLLRHMQMEEVLFFPPAMRALTADDWKEIEDRMTEGKDPLFGGETDRKYKALHKEITEWSRLFDEAS